MSLFDLTKKSPSSSFFVSPVLHCLSREYLDPSITPCLSRFNQRLSRSRLDITHSNLYRKDLFSHFGCVNAIEFSNDGQYLVSGGDDRRVLLWSVERAISSSSSTSNPLHMKGEHNSNIFCLGFDSKNKRLFSAGNDEQVIIHDTTTGETVDVVLHMEAIYGLSVDPTDDNIFATACNDGGTFIFDLRESNENQWDACIALKSNHPFHAVMHNPLEPRLLTTANTKEGVAVWDVRKTKEPFIQFTDCLGQLSPAMSVRFNCRGSLILALRRRLPPILYNLSSPFPVVEFDDKSYYNSCTMKSCCFAGGDDEYVLSGSDDFKLYGWKIPSLVMDHELTATKECLFINEASMILNGHRSIVNQVRFNYSNSMIASSGVEKVIKLWSTFPLPGGSGSLDQVKNQTVANNKDKTANNTEQGRKVYSHEDYINLVLESGQLMTHDYSHQSVQEDARMMAFFDSLVQRDIEGWTSDSSSDSDDDDLEVSRGRRRQVPRFYSFLKSQMQGRMEKMSSDSSSSDEDEEGDENKGENDRRDAMQVLSGQTLSYISSLIQMIVPVVGSSCSNKSNGQSSSAPASVSDPDPVVGPSTSSSSSSTTLSSSSHKTSCPNLSVPSTSSSSSGSSPLVTCSPDCKHKLSLKQLESQRSLMERSQSSTQRLLQSNDSSNKITQLIHSKKREQLRRVARMAIRTTRHRLKRVKKWCKPVSQDQPQTSTAADRASRFQEVSCLTNILSERVEEDARNSAEEYKIKRKKYKLRRRLRYLTNQSDYILNELDVNEDDSSSSSSDSDLDSSLTGIRRRLDRRVNIEVNGIRYTVNEGVGVSSSSSSSSSSELDAMFPPLPMTSSSSSTSASSSSESEEECDPKLKGKQSSRSMVSSRLESNSIDTRHVNDQHQPPVDSKPEEESKRNLLSCLALTVEAEEEEDKPEEREEDRITFSEAVMMTLSESNNNSNNANTDSSCSSKSESFKPVTRSNHHRSYRKRKLSGGNNNTESSNNKSSRFRQDSSSSPNREEQPN